MPDTVATQILIDRVQHGDQEALNELFRRYQLRVLAAVRIRLGAGLRRKVESWDILQEVMIDALRGINRFDYSSEGAFLKYLNRVVANKIRDEADKQNAQMRNAAREVSLEDGRSAQSGVPLISRLRDSGVPSPSQLLVLREDLALLERAMDLLPEKYGTRGEDYRDLIVAVELEQRSYRELSEEYGKSPDAIRVQFTRAKAALTRVFQELSDDE